MQRLLLVLIAIFVAGSALFAATSAHAGRVHTDHEARLAKLTPGITSNVLDYFAR